VAACAARDELKDVGIEEGTLFIARILPVVPEVARHLALRFERDASAGADHRGSA
jgi:hypothetical protein